VEPCWFGSASAAKANCRCAEGQGHESLFLVISENGGPDSFSSPRIGVACRLGWRITTAPGGSWKKSPHLLDKVRQGGTEHSRRILAYGRKVLRWEQALDAIQDNRCRPQISTSVVIRAVSVMFLSRLGSLNALGQSRPSRIWGEMVESSLPSPDTIGRVLCQIDVQGIRPCNGSVYSRLATEGIEPPGHGLHGPWW